MAKRRPRQHDIDEQACRQFASALPVDWAVRPQVKDYGVDKEVEVFDKGVSTGIIFKVQIKGTEKPNFAADRSTISFSLSVDDAVYLCEELNIPTILVLADVQTACTWWHAIQLDGDLKGRLPQARQDGQGTITMHLDPNNHIPCTVPTLLTSILESKTYLSTRSVCTSPPSTFFNALSSVDDLDALLSGLGQGASLVRLEIVERLWNQGNYASAEATVKRIIEDESSVVEAKFAALLYAERFALRAARVASQLDELPGLQLQFARQLKAISKGGPAALAVLCRAGNSCGPVAPTSQG